MAGLISVIQESITPIFDLISTVITVVSGYFLYQTGKTARNILNGRTKESSGVDRLLENYGYYLQITGVLFIVGMLVIILVVVTF